MRRKVIYSAFNPWLIAHGYGFLDFMGNQFAVRVYLKCSVFLIVGLMFEMRDFLDGKNLFYW